MDQFLVAFTIIVFSLVFAWKWLSTFRWNKGAMNRAFKKAKDLANAGEWEKAEKILMAWYKRGKIDLSNCVFLVQVLRQTNQLEQAQLVIEKASSIFELTPMAYKEWGKLLLAQNRSEQALVVFSQCLDLMQEEEDKIDLATAWFEQGEVDRAWAALENLMLQSSNGRFFALLGDCYFYRHQWHQAIACYQKALKYHWNKHQVVSRLGHGLRRLGYVEEAQVHFENILRTDSSDVLATLGLGCCLEAKGLFQEALNVYQKGKAWDLADPRILQHAGICAIYMKKFQYAEVYLQESLRRGKKNPYTLEFLGYAYECQAKWVQAERIYWMAIELFPEHLGCYRALSWLFGVGLTQTLTEEQGLTIARTSYELKGDTVALEILSACEARIGNFEIAKHIHEILSNGESGDRQTRNRRRRAISKLRQKIVLDTQSIQHHLVA